MTEWRRYDLHMHTRHSLDSLMRPRRIIELARRRGLSGIAITDHDSIAGALEARRITPPDLLVVVGEEISTDAGDIVGLFLTEEIRTRDPLEAIRRIRAQGGLAFLPHPLRGHRHATVEVIDAVQAWEALNSRAGWCAPADSGMLASLERKPRLGCSDAHLYSEIGRAFTEVPGPATEANLRARLLGGETRVGGRVGPQLNFYLSQCVKLAKTRDPAMIARALRRLRRAIVMRARRQTSEDLRRPPG
jgi:predicted metal-dependent phosphoesterase TrpH